MRIAQSSNDQLLECTEVTSKGLAYYCLACNERVHPCNTLKKERGRKKEYYFAHLSNKCKGGVESYIHFIAKKIIEESRRIYLPDGVFSYSETKMEYAGLHTSLRPDIILDNNVAIEICYTNPKGFNQINLYSEINFSAVEINLGMLNIESSLEDIRYAVLESTDNKVYLFKTNKTIASVSSKSPGPIQIFIFLSLAFVGIKAISSYITKFLRIKKGSNR